MGEKQRRPGSRKKVEINQCPVKDLTVPSEELSSTAPLECGNGHGYREEHKKPSLMRVKKRRNILQKR